MRKNKNVLMLLVTLCLTMVMTVGVAIKENTKAEASIFDYFKRTKLKDCVVSLEYDNVDWTGGAQTPKVTVSYRNVELVENVDYMVEYSNNRSAGKAEVKVRGIGDFRGKRNLTFFINGINIGKDCTYRLNGSSVYVYYKGELVDPSNYTISDKEIRLRGEEEVYPSYRYVKYYVKTKYTVTGRGKYYGSFSYVINEGVDYVKEPIENE